MAKYLDWTGLQHFWGKIKEYVKITTLNSLTTIHIGSNNVVPVTGVTAGAGLNTTSNDSSEDGGTIGGTANAGTINLTKSGVTAGDYGPSTDTAPSAGLSFSVPLVTVDKYGRITAASTKTITVPSNQTIKQDGLTGATINRFGTCSTAADTAAKTVSVTSGTVPTLDSNAAGLKITVKFANANTASSPTLNVNSKGAKNIYHKGTLITTGVNKALLAGVCDFIFDGTLWHLVGNYIDTTYTVGNKALKVSSDSGTATLAITMNESSADRTLKVGGDGTWITGAVSGSSNAPIITLSHGGPSTGSDLTTSNGAASAYTIDTEYEVLTGVTVSADTKGHVTGVSTTRQKIKNTDTKVTSVDNHYTPSADNNSELTAAISGTASAYALGTEYTVLTGVKAQRDAKGHVTGLTYTALTVKDTDTKNTAGSTDTSSKIFLVGATSQAANPQTYSDNLVFVTNGDLSANKFNSLTLTKLTTGFTIAGGTTSKTLTVNNDYTLGLGNSLLTTSDTGKIPTSAEVASFVDTQITNALIGAAMFLGVIKSTNTAPDPTALPSTGYKKGWYWIVGEAGTYAGVVCEAGDTIFCVKDYASGTASNSDFNVVQTNIETISTSDIDGLSGIPQTNS